MSRKVKQLVESELKVRYGGFESALVVDISRLTGVQANRLRGTLREKGIEMHVVKNRAMRRALADSGLGPVGKALTGPCALVTGGQTIIHVAKQFVEMLKEYPAIVLKGGLVEGDATVMPVETVATLRTRLEIIGDVVAAITGPGRRLAGCLAGSGGRVAGCLKAVADRGESAEAATPAAA